MSDSNKREESVSKRKTAPQVEEEQKTAAVPKREGPKSQGAQPSGGSKAGWLVGGSILILVLALLYTRSVEEGALKKDHHARETEQAHTHVPEHDADIKGLLYVQEKWNNVFRVEKLGSAVTLHTLRCTNSGPDAMDEVLKKVVQDIGEHTNVKNFTLQYPNCKSLSDDGVTGLAESIGKYLSKVESLEINFMELNKLGDIGVKSLFTSIGQNLHNLKHLSFIFQGIVNITPESMSTLASAMDQFPRSFQNFSLSVIWNQKITSESVIELAESIGRNFPKLTNLRLTFKSCDKVTNTIYDGASKPIGNLKNLESLTFESWISNVNPKEIQDFTDNISRLKNIKSLVLMFQRAKLNSESLAVLGNALSQNHNGLTELSLDFGGCSSINDDGIKALTKGFSKRLTNLRVLNLGLMGLESVTDEGAKAIASILNEDRKGLEELNLNLAQTNKITGAGVSAIAKNIEKNLHNLQKFKFGLPTDDGCDDATMKQIAAIFSPNVSNLRQLGLIFRGSSGLTDQGLFALADNIGNNLINLERLELDFNPHGHLKDTGAQKIAEAVSKRLPKLVDLQLRLAEIEISQSAIASLIDSLGQFRQDLRGLNFQLEGATNIDDNLVLQLTHTIATHLRNLEKFAIGFTLNRGLTDKSVKYVENLVLNNLPELQELTVKFTKATKVGNAAMAEFLINLAQKNHRINRLMASFSHLPDNKEKDRIKQYTQVIPFFPF